MKQGFDNEMYLKIQSEKIEERINMFDKLYLEFGGKIFDDYHASRVLPGFMPDAKIKLLEKLKDISEVIFCISADDIEKSKIRADYGISYELELIRLIENLQNLGISINSVVITLYNGQASVEHLKKVLKERNVKTYIHNPTIGYPNDVEVIVSDEGYGKNSYVETTKKLVVVTAPGPNSGKLGTCLSQLYHENKRGVKAGYAKFETFPVWNLGLMHPVNVAYEAATADLADVNMIDTFHLEAYGETAVSYNRDLSTFPILKNILTKITGKEIYKSPTDMGVNMIKQCISDDEAVRNAAEMEIIRRYYNALCDYKKELCSAETVERIEMIMQKLDLNIKTREIVSVALEKESKENKNIVAIELSSGDYAIHVFGKGGRIRNAPIIGTASEVAAVVNRMRAAGKNRVWEQVPKRADIHACRREYAQKIYYKYARPVELIPKSERYYCRNGSGAVYDRRAMLIASLALGHSRVNVIAGHYLER